MMIPYSVKSNREHAFEGCSLLDDYNSRLGYKYKNYSIYWMRIQEKLKLSARYSNFLPTKIKIIKE